MKEGLAAISRESISMQEYVRQKKIKELIALDLSIVLRQNGMTLPYSDIFVATVAKEHNLSVFTLDKHFETIPDLQLYHLSS